MRVDGTDEEGGDEEDGAGEESGSVSAARHRSCVRGLSRSVEFHGFWRVCGEGGGAQINYVKACRVRTLSTGALRNAECVTSRPGIGLAR